MSVFSGHVAGAALPVAFALLIAAATARAALWAPLDDERARRIAQQYLDPLTTWCLVAVAAYAVGSFATGDAGLVPLGLTLLLGAAAVLLRPTEEHTPQPAPAEPEQPAAAPAPPAEEPAMRRSQPGLWSR
jgi:hypothetical protein